MTGTGTAGPARGETMTETCPWCGRPKGPGCCQGFLTDHQATCGTCGKVPYVYINPDARTKDAAKAGCGRDECPYSYGEGSKGLTGRIDKR